MNQIDEKPREIRTLSDIRRVIEPFTVPYEKVQPLSVTTEMSWTDNEGKAVTREVIAESRDLSVRRILVEGMDVVKSKMAFIKAAMDEAELDEDDLMPEKLRWTIKMSDVDKQYFNVDAFIKKEMCGFRRGLRIRWEIDNGNYEFDPYTGKLFEAE